MDFSETTVKSRISVVLAVMLCLLLLSGLFGSWPTPLVQAGATLPPLDPPTPVAPPVDNDDDNRGSDKPLIAHIELQVQPLSTETWTVVQWQDTANQWHDVEGWRGALSSDGHQRWAVLAKDFGTGPFRWVVKQGANGEIVTTSSSFDLPAGAGEVVIIQVSL